MPTYRFDCIPAELREFDIIEFLKERCSYDPLTGFVYYKERKFENPSPRNKQWNTRFAGKRAGHLNVNGYWRVSFEKGHSWYYAHQIAFAIMEDYIPLEIDHKDKDKQNNKWENLRDSILHSNNMCNQSKQSINKSGFKGVSWSKSNNCWRMDIAYKKIKYHSYHATPEDAYFAYIAKSKELHGEFGSYD